MGMSIKPSLDWKNAHLPSLVYVLTSLSLLVMTLKREDINGELVIAIGVLLHCEYYIQYKTINKTYLCALDNSLPEHQGCFGGHHRSRLANRNIPLAVDQGSWARVCAQALVHEAPFFMFVLKVRIPSPSPSISLQAIHLQGFSWGTCEILIKKKEVLFSEEKTFYGPPSVGLLSAQLQPSPHGVPSIQRRNINHMKCISARTGLLCPIHI